MTTDSLDPTPSIQEAALDALRRYPLLRSITYGIGITAISMSSSYIIYPGSEYTWSMSHVLTFNALATPFIVALTYGFVKLRDEDQAWWRETLGNEWLRQLAIGSAIGGGAYLVVIASATVFGWVQFPAWGWNAASTSAITWTLVSHLGNILVAWNEEMLYRGYGLHSLAQAVSLPVAVTILIPLFARGHAPGWQTFMGQSALALAAVGLRLSGRSLWLPIGYHAAWNYVQTAVFGAPDASPSMRPMYVDGPKLWMGRPGYPEPGLLSTLVNLGVAAVAFLVWWRRGHQTTV